MQDLTEPILELVRLAATDLPPDVEAALRASVEQEEPGSAARGALETIIKNVELSRANSTPICQDTGTPIFYVYYPEGWSTRKLRAQIEAAVVQATEKAYLRPNSVDSLSGKNSGNNLGGDYFPSIHFEEVEGEPLTIDLMLKGGGCENVGAQYACPITGWVPGVTWQACARWCWTRCTRRRARAARRASWGLPSAATVARPTTHPRKPCFARSTTPTPTRSWLRWKSA